MDAIRQIVKSTLIKTGAISKRYQRTADRIRIVTYHGISPRIISGTQLASHLDFLKSHFEVIALTEVPERLAERRHQEHPLAVITFDDGMENNATIAAPLLAEKNLPATFFLVPGLIDADLRMMWNQELKCRLKLLGSSQQGEFFDTDTETSREFLERLKDQPDEDKRESLERARELTADREFDQWMVDEYQIMSRSQARNLPDNIQIGSHSIDHPILTSVAPEEARRQIIESRSMLTKMVDRPVESFCYPNGDFNSAIRDCAAGHYRVAVGTRAGFAQPGDDIYALPRVHAAIRTTDLATALA